ncbi:hypothetical protein GCM10022410_21370 [Amphibacillus indicireducens]|uniref:Uncharacterized protein n=1 Tax=Amphibacillus indicireducens TaxID=1076330 RepID=A0ABP7VXA4_9BACI
MTQILLYFCLRFPTISFILLYNCGNETKYFLMFFGMIRKIGLKNQLKISNKKENSFITTIITRFTTVKKA